MGSKLLIISPARNEAAYIRTTIESVIAQSLRPAEWIIVDDQSTDETRSIAEGYARDHSWIRVASFPKALPRVPGGKVVQIFYAGLEYASCKDYDFIVKLDTDLELVPDYFEFLVEKFREDPDLGIASGICMEKRGDAYVEEKVAPHHAHGATKIYRRACFEAIGGLKATLGWDGLDEYAAMSQGWKTGHFRDVSFKHFRPTGAEGGILEGKFRMGYSFWLIGYHPLFLLARCLRKIMDPPAVLGSAAILWGYIFQALKRTPHASSPELRKFIHRLQILKLTGRSVRTGTSS